MGDVFTFRFEVLLPERGWVPYTAEALGVDEEDPHLGGDITLIDQWGDISDFAARELENALADFSDEDPGLEGFSGLRVLAWIDETSAGQPAAMHTATAEQLARGRLRRVRRDVDTAAAELRQAHTHLRAQVLTAAAVDRLHRDKIIREVGTAWPEDEILQYLAGFDLVRQVSESLPNGWARSLPWNDDPELWSPLWLCQVGPYDCGPVTIVLEQSGAVRLSVGADDVELAVMGRHDPEPDEEEAHRRVLRRQRLANAETVFPALIEAGFALTAESGRKAHVEDLMAGPITVTRPD